MQYNIAKHDGTLCDFLLNIYLANYFFDFPQIAIERSNNTACQRITKTKPTQFFF